MRYSVFFAIKLKTRRVHIAGISSDPTGAWMAQLARNLTDAEVGFRRSAKRVIVDRDPLYTEQFKSTLASAGVELLKLPASSPNSNAYAEPFVGSIRRECLNKFVPLGEGHLRGILRQFVDHYHSERHHQGISSRLVVLEAALQRRMAPSRGEKGSVVSCPTITRSQRDSRAIVG